MKIFFGCHPKYDLHEKIFIQKVAQKLFGKVWGNSGKNPSHPQICACSFIYAATHGNTKRFFVTQVSSFVSHVE